MLYQSLTGSLSCGFERGHSRSWERTGKSAVKAACCLQGPQRRGPGTALGWHTSSSHPPPGTMEPVIAAFLQVPPKGPLPSKVHTKGYKTHTERRTSQKSESRAIGTRGCETGFCLPLGFACPASPLALAPAPPPPACGIPGDQAALSLPQCSPKLLSKGGLPDLRAVSSSLTLGPTASTEPTYREVRRWVGT